MYEFLHADHMQALTLAIDWPKHTTIAPSTNIIQRVPNHRGSLTHARMRWSRMHGHRTITHSMTQPGQKLPTPYIRICQLWNQPGHLIPLYPQYTIPTTTPATNMVYAPPPFIYNMLGFLTLPLSIIWYLTLHLFSTQRAIMALIKFMLVMVKVYLFCTLILPLFLHLHDRLSLIMYSIFLILQNPYFIFKNLQRIIMSSLNSILILF